MNKIYEKPSAELIEFETECIMSGPGIGDIADVSWGIGDESEYENLE